MRYRILAIGIDMGLLETRQALLTSRGYDSVIATPEDVDESCPLAGSTLSFFSAMLSEEEKRLIQSKIPPGTRPLVLEKLVWPEELLRLVAEALG
jgi:hypothetical protein